MTRDQARTDRIVRPGAAVHRPHRRYILCVDDDQAVLNQLIHQLTRRFGRTHRVEGAESAEEALELTDKLTRDGGRVEMVICDQIMPGMRGDRCLEVLNRRHPDMIRILLTGHAGLESATYAINHAGLHKYIEKPWDVEDLGLTVHNLLTQYSLNQELKEYHRELERKNTGLKSLQSLGVKLALMTSTDDLPAAVLECARKIAPTERVALYLSGSALRTGADCWSTTPEAVLDAVERRRIVERLFVEEVPDAPQPSCFEMALDLRPVEREAGPEQAKAYVFPIKTQEHLYGALVCVCPKNQEPTTPELEILTILTNEISISLENKILLEQRILSEKLAAIGRMVSAITHDYRTPMTVVKGYSEMLEYDEVEPADVRKFAALIGREVDRMEGMIEELLDFVRGARGTPHFESCTLGSIVQEALAPFSEIFSKAGIRTDVAFSEPGPVRADPEKLKRVFTNLIRNALEAMPTGGKLKILLEPAGAHYQVRVRDSGAGIPPEVLSRVFEPFYSKGKSKGLGLGTSIARSIIEEHGGTITVESTSSGTTFTVVLPKLVPSPRDSSAE